MRVFKPYYYRNGRRHQVKKWWIEFRDHLHIRRRVAAFTDKAQSEALGRKIVKLANYKAAGEYPDATLSRWLEQIPNKLQSRLAEFALLDTNKMAATKVLTEHVDDFIASLKAKERAKKHVKHVKSTLLRIFDECEFNYWSNISANRLEYYLAGLRECEEISARTFNHKLKTVKQFCTWMVKNGKATESPVGYLECLNEETDKRLIRRALEPDEIRYLLKTIEKALPQSGMEGYERSLLYRLACETGLRAEEIRSLCVSSFNLFRKTLTVKAAYSKRKREDVLPLRPDTALELQEHFKSKHSNALAFNVPEKTGKMIKKDLKLARDKWVKEAKDSPREHKRRLESDFLKIESDRGTVDFHGLRHTTGSLLADAGVHPKVAQEIMRHSDINLTMSTYTHVLRGRESEAVAALPDFSIPHEETKLATGTYDVTPDENLSQILSKSDGKQRISTDFDEQKEVKEKGPESVILSQNQGFSAKNANERCRARTCDPLIKSQLLYQLS